MTLLLNCDLGESFGNWKMGLDAEAMPHIDLANIACGFHAGDPLVMQKTLTLAAQHHVTIGAHPAYPDLVGFGRRSMTCSTDELSALLLYQISSLDGMAQSMGLQVDYVKPHGALYNDMMADATIRATVMAAVASYHRPVKLMLLATKESEIHQQEASNLGLNCLFEAFADRRYDEQGMLVSRRRAAAVLNREQTLEQVQNLAKNQAVTNIAGQQQYFPKVDTLCVHGDNIDAVQAIKDIRHILRT